MDISKLLQHADRHARTCLTDEFLDLLCAVPGRLVLFLDTYEMLQQAGDPDTIGWLWGGLLVRTHQRCAGLRVIVGSREKLDLAHDLLALSEQVQAFSPKDCDAFLRNCGLSDAALRDAIYALTRGHPLLTNMAVELWRQGQETGRPVSQQEIREGLEARVPTEWLYGRIVDRLAEPLKSAARYGALLRRFNQEILNACLPEESPRLNDAAFREFIGRSFVERRGHYWACHDLVREAQIGWLRRQHPGEFDEFNHRVGHLLCRTLAGERRAARITWRRCTTTSGQMRNRPETPGGMPATMRSSGERAWLAELLALAESHDLARKPLEPQTQGDILFRRANWLYYGDEYPLARQRYAEARPIYHEIGDRLGEANCIRSLGDVHLHLAEYPLARQRYAEARPIYHEIGARRGEANCIRSLGDVHLQLAEYPLARQRYAEARPIYHEIGARLGEANCIRASATCTCTWPSTRSPASATQKPGPSTTKSAPASAKPTALEPRRRAPAPGRVPARPPALRRSRPIYHEIGDRLGEANCIRSLGDVHLRLAEYPLARQRYAEARPIYHEIGARLGEANCITSLGDVHLQLAEYPLARQRYAEARPIYHEIGARLGEANCIRASATCTCTWPSTRSPASATQKPGPSTTKSAPASAKPTASSASATCTCNWPSTRSPASATQKPGPSSTRSAPASAKPTASSSLGDVHLYLAEYPLARQRYAEARPIFHEIGARLGEAGCLLGLGDVMAQMGERPDCASRGRRAALYQAIGLSYWEQVARDRMTRIRDLRSCTQSARVSGRAGVGSCVAAGGKCAVGGHLALLLDDHPAPPGTARAGEGPIHGGCVSSSGPARRTGDAALFLGAILPQLLESTVLQDVDVIDLQPGLGRDLVS